ncbi:uncharacterized protein TNIN_169981 [Trichonephila inaurata madagascariensis]|uniref:Uncharacterized protein n=1 Tax=Trichonephila inaurata madagascariensis TaxID=2747483 RepID=A0A8X7BZN8_9ARAC|nr:uncharacterized protein TNIN_169981 [Trichonephila inaurata madagascariensis]
MDSSRPKVLKSKIPVKVPVKSRIQLSIPITEREIIEKEGKEKSHTQSTTVKKRIYPVKVQQTVNSNNKYNCTSKAAKCSSSNYYRRSEIKTEFKNPWFQLRKRRVNNFKNDFPMSESEKQLKNTNHISQQNIIFEADERFRHHILSGKELTPSMLNSWSSKKQSSTYERPSLYKKFKAPANAIQEVLKSIENKNFAAEGRVTELKKVGYSSPLKLRNSLYEQSAFVGDPFQEAFKNLAELRLKQKLKDKKKVTFNLSASDPLSETENEGENHKTGNNKERNSLYKQRVFVGDPLQEALNSLAELRIKQQLKDKKKVTFNLPVTDSLHTTVSDDENSNKINSKSRLTDIDKESYGSNSPSIPEFPGEIFYQKILKIPAIEVIPSTPAVSSSEDISKKVYKNCNFRSIEENKSEFCSDMLNVTTPPISCSRVVPNTTDSILKSGASLFKEKGYNNFKGLGVLESKIRRSFMKPSNPLFNTFRTSELRSSLCSIRSEQPRQRIFSKLCTPKPISFNPDSKLTEDISPAFFSRRTSNILSHAPINTPLVLKSLANSDLDNCEFSLICKKLDFSDSPQTTHKDEDSRKENTQTFYLQSILTQQKILDQLAHQECNILMHATQFPSYNRLHLRNPVAQILLEGDEMHFVPVTMI